MPYKEIIGRVEIPYDYTHNKISLGDKLINVINIFLLALKLPSIKIKDDASR